MVAGHPTPSDTDADREHWQFYVDSRLRADYRHKQFPLWTAMPPWQLRRNDGVLTPDKQTLQEFCCYSSISDVLDASMKLVDLLHPYPSLMDNPEVAWLELWKKRPVKWVWALPSLRNGIMKAIYDPWRGVVYWGFERGENLGMSWDTEDRHYGKDVFRTEALAVHEANRLRERELQRAQRTIDKLTAMEFVPWVNPEFYARWGLGSDK